MTEVTFCPDPHDGDGDGELVRLNWSQDSRYVYLGKYLDLQGPDKDGDLSMEVHGQMHNTHAAMRIWIPMDELDTVIAALQWFKAGKLGRMILEKELTS